MTTIHWDEDDIHGTVLEPADRMEQTLEAVERLRSAESLSELQSADLPSWARHLVDSVADDRFEEADDSWDWWQMAESVTDVVPLPWDAGSVSDWLDREVLDAHAKVGGASPGGNIGTQEVHDRDGLFAELEQRGYTLEHRPGLVKSFYDAL